MLSDRVRELRRVSVETVPYVSTERAELLTEFYNSGMAENLSKPVERAMAFKYIMENKEICINRGELIVGERGPVPRATPTYPELCCHSIKDLRVANTRSRSRFVVTDETECVYKETVIPFWKGKTMRERVFDAMSEEWQDAFHAGVFTEFMEQRAPGHAILDDKIYVNGLRDFQDRIAHQLDRLDFYEDSEAYSKQQQLRAMHIAAEAVIVFAERHADLAARLAAKETNRKRRDELEQIAEVCSWVPANPPRTFWEALQMYWFVHLGVITELNVWDSFNPGRIDQNLNRFLNSDLREKRIKVAEARELLCCLWIKFNNQPAPPKVDVTEEQSGTYQDFALINIGGVDSKGDDGVNELSHLVLKVMNEMRLIQPSVCIQLSTKNPDSFLLDAIDVIKEGFGQPSVFNTDVIIQEFLRAGKTIEDARAGGPSGCVTISAFGKESCILTGYCNWPKILEITLNNGIDPKTKKRLGPETGDPRSFTSFEQLMNAYRVQLEHFINIKIKGNNVIERLYAEYMPAPFLSLLFDDCIERGKDYHDGGPRYNSTYIQGVGLGTLTDSLTAINYAVFDKELLSMDELLQALSTDFEGLEDVRLQLSNRAPKYGNDDDYADMLARDVFEAYFNVVDGRPNTKGGQYRVNLLPTTVHIYFGRVTGATPNGRKAGLPLSDGISPSPGADRKGPTAVMKSVAKIDHVRTGGTLLNQKLMPSLLEREEGKTKLGQLIRTYFRLGGHHVQFNIIETETLLEAQRNPERHRDLIVRVAGYSDYFVDVGRELQDEIIVRTLHDKI